MKFSPQLVWASMGEVHRAPDTRLDRIIAIRVLSARLADRSELHDRFEREAPTSASLNHPYICTLYDIVGALIWRETKNRDART
jgi:serine/threonine protein kinase